MILRVLKVEIGRLLLRGNVSGQSGLATLTRTEQTSDWTRSDCALNLGSYLGSWGNYVGNMELDVPIFKDNTSGTNGRLL